MLLIYFFNVILKSQVGIEVLLCKEEHLPSKSQWKSGGIKQGRNQVCSQRWAKLENFPHIQWRKRNIFLRGQSHISRFFSP